MLKKKLIFILIFTLTSYSLKAKFSFEKQIVKDLSKYIKISKEVKQDLYDLAEKKIDENKIVVSDSNYLFSNFPKLKDVIPYISFCDLPTPVTNAKNLAKILKIKKLYIKRDDLTGKRLPDGSKLFGGNKPRKLEFLLAQALNNNAKSVLTFGCAGSNHATATAVYCKQLGLKSILMLKPQVNSHVISRNLLLNLYNDAEIIYSPTNNLRSCATVTKFFTNKQTYGTFPYVIPTGASCALGALGFVNAAFELKEQIEKENLSIPTRIYVPLGSAGTMVGLLIGFKLANLKIRIIGVTIEPEEKPQEFLDKVYLLFKQVSILLNATDPNIEVNLLSSEDFEIIHECCGQEYGLFTPEAKAAINMLKTSENVILDGVYTGKAFSGLLADIQKKNLYNETILFWNTFCSDQFSNQLIQVDYRNLPHVLHSYFETEVQELDL